MKKFARLDYNNFYITGEVNERLPLNLKNEIEDIYPLDGTIDSYYPDSEIRVSDGVIKDIRSNSNIVRNSGVTIKDGCMNFSGTADSFLELNKDLINAKNIDIEIKFKIEDFSSSIRTIFASKRKEVGKSENELSLIVNCPSRLVYLDMYNYDKSISNTPDWADLGSFALTPPGSINKNIWYTLRFVRYNNIVSFSLNGIVTKTLVCGGDIKSNFIFIGQEPDGANSDNHYFDANQAFKGLIEYIKIKKISDKALQERHSFSAESFSKNYSVSMDWNLDLLGTYNIFNLGDITFKSNVNKLEVLKAGTKLYECPVVEDHDYYILCSYNKTSADINILVYDKTSNNSLINETYKINMSPQNIDVILNGTLFNLCIFKESVDTNRALTLLNKRFSLDSTGDINYILEESDYKLKDFRKTHYEIFKQSGTAQPEALINLTEKYNEIATKITETNIGWDNNLHKDAYRLGSWANGYNGGVENSTRGYHAKWVKEGIDSGDICAKFINCNREAGTANRWLGTNLIITPEQLWNSCKVGDNIKIVFKARSDKKGNFSIGLYRRRISDGTQNFDTHRKYFDIEGHSWKDFVYETTIDSDWDLNKSTPIYLYGGHIEDVTVWMQDIFLIKNGEAVSPDILLNKDTNIIKIDISKNNQITVNNKWQVLYSKEIHDLTDGRHFDSIGEKIHWGIENGNVVFKYLNGQNEISNIIAGISPKDIMHETLFVSISYNNQKTKLQMFTRRGLFESEINTGTLSSHIINLGGIGDSQYGCSTYYELDVIKDEIIDRDILESHFRTKVSYKNNTLYTSITLNEVDEL